MNMVCEFFQEFFW